jgi:hypothetical protein
MARLSRELNSRWLNSDAITNDPGPFQAGRGFFGLFMPLPVPFFYHEADKMRTCLPARHITSQKFPFKGGPGWVQHFSY